MPGCLAPTNKEDLLLIGGQKGISFLNTKTGVSKLWIERDKMEPGFPGNRFNDGKIDPQGRSSLLVPPIVTSLDFGLVLLIFLVRPLMELYFQSALVAPSKHSSPRFSPFLPSWPNQRGISNGLAWTQKSMFYIDSPTCKVLRYDFNPETGNISNET